MHIALPFHAETPSAFRTPPFSDFDMPTDKFDSHTRFRWNGILYDTTGKIQRALFRIRSRSAHCPCECSRCSPGAPTPHKVSAHRDIEIDLLRYHPAPKCGCAAACPIYFHPFPSELIPLHFTIFDSKCRVFLICHIPKIRFHHSRNAIVRHKNIRLFL